MMLETFQHSCPLLAATLAAFCADLSSRVLRVPRMLCVPRVLRVSRLVVAVCCACPSSAVAADAFSRGELLRMFDANRNQQLDALERAACRESFGGIDVPMLPQESRYTASQPWPKQVAWRELDNEPVANQLTEAGATLGRVLFYDRQMSFNNTIACASCHLQQQGFSDPRRLSRGYNGGLTGRNAMGLVNLRFTRIRGGDPGFFWDERAATLEEQVLMPIQDKIEMGMELNDLEARLQMLPYYPALFQRAFGSQKVTRQRIGMAVAQFMRAMVSFDSKFDRGVLETDGNWSVDFTCYSERENLGKSLFIDGVAGIAEIGCAHCHVPPSFAMPKAFNNGLDLDYRDQGLGARSVPANDPFTPSNDGKFKAPSLRNIGLTAPYMHDGRFETLEQVIDHYSDGVQAHSNVGLAFNDDSASSGGTVGFRLTSTQKSALVDFLQTLTDDAFVNNPMFADPFVRLAD